MGDRRSACLTTVLLWCCTAIDAQAGSPAFDLRLPGGQYLTYPFSLVGPAEPLVDAAYTGEGALAGRTLYYRDWLDPDGGTPSPVGPDFDASSCAACHVETAIGSGRHDAAPLVARPLGASGRRQFGSQASTRRVDGAPPEAELVVKDIAVPFVYVDGTRVTLRRRLGWAVTTDGNYLPVSLRTAPLLFGWGLLERVDPLMLVNFHDPDDRNGDGISGRMVFRATDCHGVAAPATLGWKNTHAGLKAQIAAALEDDMGIATGTGCGASGYAEITGVEVDRLVDYVRRLGVPDRRPAAADALGEALFGLIGCADCHAPVLVTADRASVSDPPGLAGQLIWPYSDLMLHDMGPDLADPGGDTDAREWRTAPLWGIGIAETHLPGRGFLHDGRARTIEEAILWHGGEARPSRDRFASLSRTARDALLDYVRSL